MPGTCRITGENLTEVMDFGNPYVSDFVDRAGQGERAPLKLGISQAGLVQLYDSYSAEKMYGANYWYQSGINESMRRALWDVTQGAKRWVALRSGDVVLDIGCNDGTLLGSHPSDYTRIGFDPSINVVEKAIDSHRADIVVNDFFSAEAFHHVSTQKAKVITAIAMFYDIEDPVAWTQEVADCLTDDGILIIQQSYMPLMLKQNAFDNICHEHLTYQSLSTMSFIMRSAGLYILDVELNGVNGGSFRIYAGKSQQSLIAADFDLDVAAMRVHSLMSYERAAENMLCLENQLTAFANRVRAVRAETVDLLERLVDDNKTVVGLGASTKGNTLLQYYGIGPGLLPAIAERTPSKVGKLTAGSWIPIISEDEMRAMKPDYLFVLPWHFVSSIQQREAGLLANGTRLIVPLPQLKIVDPF